MRELRPSEGAGKGDELDPFIVTEAESEMLARVANEHAGAEREIEFVLEAVGELDYAIRWLGAPRRYCMYCDEEIGRQPPGGPYRGSGQRNRWGGVHGSEFKSPLTELRLLWLDREPTCYDCHKARRVSQADIINAREPHWRHPTKNRPLNTIEMFQVLGALPDQRTIPEMRWDQWESAAQMIIHELFNVPVTTKGETS